MMPSLALEVPKEGHSAACDSSQVFQAQVA